MLSNLGENQTRDLSLLIIPLQRGVQNTDLLYMFRLQAISHGEEEETHWIVLGKPRELKFIFVNNP